MDKHMMGNGKIIKEMEQEFGFLQKVKNMKVNGQTEM